MTTRTTRTLHLFEATGVEIEFMIVDRATLDVLPVADRLLQKACGAGPDEWPEDFVNGPITWSNELATHVLELKTTDPAPTLAGLDARFVENINKANELLAPMNGMLLPGAMHPWMNPEKELKLWPHGYSPVYEAFNRIFDCRGHGWANLQSMHLNLPFSGDEEFGKLHAAIRLLLPIMPALSAGSPIMDGKPTGLMDSRLDVYRQNSRAIPSIAGLVVPEPVYTQADYERVIFKRIDADLAPHDPGRVLQHEWANSRGCIARFSRGSVEIRVLDAQESPRANLAIAQGLVATLRAIVEGRFGDHSRTRSLGTERLHAILLETIRHGDQARITDRDYLNALGIGVNAASRVTLGDATPSGVHTAGEIWRWLFEQSSAGQEALAFLDRGPLARRLLHSTGSTPGRSELLAMCKKLALCSTDNSLF